MQCTGSQPQNELEGERNKEKSNVIQTSCSTNSTVSKERKKLVPGGDQLEQDNSGATSKTKKKMAQGGSHREQKSGENGGTASKAKSGDEKE